MLLLTVILNPKVQHTVLTVRYARLVLAKGANKDEIRGSGKREPARLRHLDVAGDYTMAHAQGRLDISAILGQKCKR